MQLILASESPRRRELLKLIGLEFSCVASKVNETGILSQTPEAIVEELALKKALAVSEHNTNACIIGADTIVYIDDEIIGKPIDDNDAIYILDKLQGKTHTVYTGIAVLSPKLQSVSHDATRVTFVPMDKTEILWYVSTGEPRDKAGAYGIQGPGGIFIERIEGNYFTVIGLPLPLLYKMLKKAGAMNF